MTPATPQRTRAPHRYTPPLGTGPATRAGHTNGGLYAYAANSPVCYTDPDGRRITDAASVFMQESTGNLADSDQSISGSGCTFTSYVRMAIALGADVTLDMANKIAMENKLFTGDNELTCANGAALVNAILADCGITDVSVAYEASVTPSCPDEKRYLHYYHLPTYLNCLETYAAYEESDHDYFCTARINTSSGSHSSYYGHTVSVGANALVSDRCDGLPTNIRIRDTSTVGRSQLDGDPSGRANTLERMDFFRINRLATPAIGENE